MVGLMSHTSSKDFHSTKSLLEILHTHLGNYFPKVDSLMMRVLP
jgi:hypothetical protein